VSSAAIASSRVLVRAISMSGIAEPLLPSERFPDPFGAFSGGPSSSASASNPSSAPTASSIPAQGSPISANRSPTVAIVNASGLQSGTSSQCSGVETPASGVAPTQQPAPTVPPLAFHSQ